MRQGQVVGQIFIYILMIVVVGVIFIIAYNYFISLNQKKCDLDELTFAENIKDFADRYKSYGSLEKQSLNAPCTYKQACFVSADKIGDSEFTMPDYLIIQGSVRQGVEQNIFLIGDKAVKPIGYAPEIEAGDTDYVCIDRTAGKFRIQFSGNGLTTTIGTYE